MVLWYWRPGSAHCHAASAIWRHRSLAFTVFITRPSVRAVRFQSPLAMTAWTNSLDSRTELLEFWPDTVAYASPLKSAS
jgi:hypothetical protein